MSDNSVQLVIFDCDGVLVDSEPLENALLAEALRGEGMDISAEEATRRFIGMTMPQVVEDAEARLGRPLPGNFLDRLQRRTFDAFRDRLRTVPGAAEAVWTVRGRGIAVCVASNGDLDKMAVSLDVSGLAPLFSGHIFSYSQVARGKPHPDLFLFAAERMGVSPKACLVVEDSDHGVKAALAADMAVLRYVPDGTETSFTDDVPVIRLLSEIEDWL